MTLEAPPPSRRALRAQTAGPGAEDEPRAEDEPGAHGPPDDTESGGDVETIEALLEAAPTPVEAGRDVVAPVTVESGDGAVTRLALGWVDPHAIALAPGPAVDLTAAEAPYLPVETDLLADAPRRSPLHPAVIAPIAIVAALAGAYASTTLLWPLAAVAPTIAAAEVQSLAAPVSSPAWPATGSAAVSVAGMPGALASGDKAGSIASITKVVTALLVLDELPLELGEQGPEYAFTWRDHADYQQYVWGGQSALDVPVDGTLTEYQMLEGMLIGSANNYANRLARDLWPTSEVFAGAAKEWLDEHDVDGVTVVDPSGIKKGNKATPEALLTLAQRALQNPVIAEIVAKKSVELPGAGTVKNTNGLMADEGVIGVKTGYLEPNYNLLSAKEIMVGDTEVRMYASVLGQKSSKARVAASRALFAQLESELVPTPSVLGGTVVGTVETAWGEKAPIVTASPASVVLWNGASGAVATAFALGELRDEGDVVGSLTVAGPLDTDVVDVRLADDIEDPTAWWRLTHPLELFGLVD